MIPIASRRLEALPTSYAMARALALRSELESQGRDVIDLSIGHPFLPAPEQAHEALLDASRGVAFNRYPPFGGTGELRRAFAAFYQRRYGATLDPDSQILPLLGTKEGLANLSLAFADEDKPVYCNPVAYPVYRLSADLASARVIDLGGTWERGYVPGPPPGNRTGGIAFIDSPGNPTGAVVPRDVVEGVLAEFRRRRIVFCFDAAYAELRGTTELMLPIPHFGDDGVVELHSLSKSLSLASWRIGFAVGSSHIIKILAKTKTFTDSGVPLPVQIATAEVLGRCDPWIDQARLTYVEYQREFRAALRELPIELFPTDASMFCWARVPGVPGEKVAEACAEEAVVVMAGDSFGPGGGECFRMTAVLTGERLEELRRRLERVCGALAVPGAGG